MFGLLGNDPIFCCLIHAAVGDDLFVLSLGEPNINPKPVLLFVLLPVPVPVPVAVAFLSVVGE